MHFRNVEYAAHIHTLQGAKNGIFINELGNPQNYWVSGLGPSCGILNTVIEVGPPLWFSGQSS
jgi:hypothetical protein